MTSKLLEGTVIDNNEKEYKVADLTKDIKYLGIYFSAHWCPPCCKFTPLLSDFYGSHHEEKSFDIIFLSFDNGEDEFKEYFREMPWKAVPLTEKEMIKQLVEEHKVSGIPHLVFIDAKTGDVMTSSGRNKVMDDKDGENFPWKE